MSRKMIFRTLATTIFVAVTSVLVSRLFHTEISAAVFGGLFGGIMSLYFEKGSKPKES